MPYTITWCWACGRIEHSDLNNNRGVGCIPMAVQHLLQNASAHFAGGSRTVSQDDGRECYDVVQWLSFALLKYSCIWMLATLRPTHLRKQIGVLHWKPGEFFNFRGVPKVLFSGWIAWPGRKDEAWTSCNKGGPRHQDFVVFQYLTAQSIDQSKFNLSCSLDSVPGFKVTIQV